MPIQLKNTYIHIVTAVLIFGAYSWCVFGLLGVDYFTGPEALARIGKAITTLIVGGYAFELSIVFGALLLGPKLLKDMSHDWTLDERDMKIFYRSIHLSHLVLCAGLFASMGALAIGFEPFWVFNFLVLAFLFSVVAELGAKLYLYQSGT